MIKKFSSRFISLLPLATLLVLAFVILYSPQEVFSQTVQLKIGNVINPTVSSFQSIFGTVFKIFNICIFFFGLIFFICVKLESVKSIQQALEIACDYARTNGFNEDSARTFAKVWFKANRGFDNSGPKDLRTYLSSKFNFV